MKNETVLNRLIAKRAQLAGDIERAHEALRKMVTDLDHLDQTILQFDPDYRVESIKAEAFRFLATPEEQGHREGRTGTGPICPVVDRKMKTVAIWPQFI